MLDLAGADSHCERTECAVRRRMTVAAHHGGSGLRQAELRSDHMHDALVEIAHAVQANSELLAISAQGVDLSLGHRICDRLVDVDRRNVVVLGGNRQVGTAQLASRQAKSVECLGARHFVNEVEIDVDEVGILPLPFHDNVVVPHLLGESACFLCHVFHLCT